jgi:regulatory protein
MQLIKQHLTPGQAFEKAKQYCGYQERCHSEVKAKLYSFSLTTPEVEECISKLIEENYLNEERFAIAFAGGKFRIKHWGRVKIKYELKKKFISDYCINKALAEIAEEDYLKVFEKVYEESLTALKKEKNIFIKKKKLQDYVRQRGFETELITEKMKLLGKA